MSTSVIMESESENRDASPVYVTLLNAMITVTNLCLGGVTICALTLMQSVAASTSVKQHVYLCVIGYVILMTQAVHLLNPHSGWARLVKYENRKMVHWTLQIMGTILVSIGSVIRMTDMTNHFSSAHGILGILAFTLTILTMIGGIVNSNSKRWNLNTTYIKVSHSCSGSLTLCSAFLSLIFAIHNSYRFAMGYQNANILIALTVFGLVGTLFSPCLDVIMKLRSR